MNSVNLFPEKFDIRACRKGDHIKPLRVESDQIEGTPANRAGRAEDGELCYPCHRHP